ncbi:MAG: arginine--tRNA ligase [Bacillota bacterium]
MDYKKHISEKLATNEVTAEEILSLIVSQTGEKGDFALPCFKFAKLLKKSPVQIAEGFKSVFDGDSAFSKIESVAGYLNFFTSKAEYSKMILEEILELGENFGTSNMGEGKTICIDYSSINIAKPFHIGHLSTTAIGASLYRTYKHLGFDVVGINYLGDWGTQFGKMISAYRRWGDKELIEKGGVDELVKIYVKFHKEAEFDDELNDEARGYFKQIEDGVPEIVELFNWFKKITLEEVGKIYDILGITFDSYNGESFFNDKMQPVIEELKEKNLLVESNGAHIVDLEPYGMPPCLILRSDGATLYATRDLAAAEYRAKTYNFYKSLYVVAYQQNLHFKQVFKVLELAGKEYAKDMVHVAFGMVSVEGKPLSTRGGNVVLLKDALAKSADKAKEIMREKNPNLENLDEIAKTVGYGAVVFFALSNSRIKDIDFCYDKALSFEGESGPYVQYTFTRCGSVLAKAKEAGIDFSNISYENVSDTEFELLKLLSGYKETLVDVIEKYEPSYIARRLLDIAKAYNKFYYEHRILNAEEDVKNLRLAITKATADVLKGGLSLLGVGVPEKM